ncbi:SGNH/GDSL hydrolase family protein [Streptomyces litchfieldiae]|uniref:SGNH/GDSL hydrolase family protein n=1 Tax=Streptomyces litchfieldiae TaxID=3075543 RepID=A0ABU2MWD4_9ACTN|nr:SGNH/GDSL hydrolase family protein [Streptomyces sp. DSM 44938]MDT0345956.1 SGNH/GDSL hydrolase family protein [Streptomyces sp. DSM 44938]
MTHNTFLRRLLGALLPAALPAALLGGLLLGAQPAPAAAAPAHRPEAGAFGPGMVPGGPAFTDQTIRMVVHPSVAGTRPRLRVSNLRGSADLRVGALAVALRASGGAAVPGSHRAVTFADAPSTTIRAGGELLSDPVPIRVERGRDLLVSIHLPDATGPSTQHRHAYETTYLTPPGSGDHTADAGAGDYTATTGSWYYLAGLSVVPATAATTGTLVAFGDSITDGTLSTPGTNRRWPDLLADRLAAEPGGQRLGVVNAGIFANRMLSERDETSGRPALERFSHDALGQPGVATVIVLEGINDITAGVNAEGLPLAPRDLIDGYRTLIGRAHDAGVRIIGGTLLPNGNHSAGQNAIRTAVNDWIRTGGEFDAVIDFDRATRDPARPDTLRPAYDSGDGLHPNDAGMRAMADAVDLAALTVS